MNGPVAAVFFDLDGTLADTAPDLGGALNELRGQRGLPAVPLARLRPYTSQGVRGMLRAGLDLAPGDPDYADTARRLLDLYEARLCRETTLFPGVAELLAECARREVACGVVTNKTQRFTPRLMRLLGIDRGLACAVSGDSSPRIKPSPRPLLLAARLAGAEPARCLYVGDDERDVVAGRAAGMCTVAVRWGYHGDGPPVEAWNADRIADHPRDVAALLTH